jgi:hypothetical protein
MSKDELAEFYKNIKGIFINGEEEITDFSLGKSKPKNLFYIGGIHLKWKDFNKMLKTKIQLVKLPISKIFFI